ncbi:MAG: hypothetical protein M3O36_17845 [Myxococcota bacterium]|nr:hypothetical protein [Myxococcota bacterium]
MGPSVVRPFPPRWQGLAFLAALCAVALAACRGEPASLLNELAEARRVSADLRLQFSQASDASNRAVMADTDEASVAFAHEAEQGKQAVHMDVEKLAPHLHSLGYAAEARWLEEFTRRFADYGRLDETVLALAVENTNLKAQRLSFGPAHQAADQFRDALDALVSSAAAKSASKSERCIESVAARAILAVRDVQVLQAPHIAEADDAAMSRIEAEMSRLHAVAADAVRELARRAEAQPTLEAASASLERFTDLSAQIVALSRRNSNVRSLALSLRDKPPLTARCEDSLRSLDEALAKEGFSATR